MNIRSAKRIDASAILEITEQAWIEQYALPEVGLSIGDIKNLGITKQGNVEKQGDMLERISPRRITLVADDGGRTVGYILLVKREEVGWYLKSIYISSAYRSNGVGASLLSKGINRLRKNEPGVRLITLDVVESNNRAIEFYLQHGWKKRGNATFMIGPQRLPTVTMVMNIKL